MCSHAQRCTGHAQWQQLRSAFKETLLFRGRLLSSQEGMWPREREMYCPFCRHWSQELTAAAQAMQPSRRLGAPQHSSSRTSSAAPRAAMATKDESLAGTSCWSQEEGKNDRSSFIISAFNQLLGWTSSAKQRKVSELLLAGVRQLLSSWLLQDLTRGARTMHPHLPQRPAWTWAAAAKTSWSLQVNHSAKPCRTNHEKPTASNCF